MTILRQLPHFFVLVLLCVYANSTLSHPGALDFQGGHVNSQKNEYHCHKEPCFSNRKHVADAHQAAVESGVALSSLYNRDDWPHWIDEDNDCQDTRVEILLSSSLYHAKFKNINECAVTWGIWYDPYTGETILMPPKWILTMLCRWLMPTETVVLSGQRKENVNLLMTQTTLLLCLPV